MTVSSPKQTWRSSALDQVATVREGLRSVVRHAVREQRMTAAAVTAYAALHLTTDNSQPIIPAAHHRLWLELLCTPEITQLLIIAPPESAKTTWILSAFLGLHVGIWPERSVIIGSATGPIAEKRSLSLRATVDSPNWRTTFPTVQRANGLPWKTNEWSLAPNGSPHPGRLHPTIAAYGTGGSVIGSRADLVVADDLLDQKNASTSYQRDFVEEWFDRSFLSRRKSKTGRVVVVGTTWHHDDLYARLLKKGGWVGVRLGLLSESNEVYATLSYPDGWKGPVLGERIGETMAEPEATPEPAPMRRV